ncbi:MAG TPA: sigma-70 family RNA polymerase sigma factor [Chitinophagaceae bacterium]|nr:sigma-70 family RNA polymerase sigma factor [Chitinophagaceae bacterium]
MTTAFQEKELLKGLAKSDKTAAESIYKDHYSMVQALIINNNGSADDARDIFQETMIVLYEKARSGSFELNCQLKTFIYAVSRRLWLKRLQQLQKFSGQIEQMEETVPVEEDLEQHDQADEQFKAMEKSLLNLGEPCKSLIEAYYLQKRNMTEIAASFGYTNADNAKNQKYKCLMRLKKLFFAQHKNKDQ